MKNKLLFGVALCLGLFSMASAQFGGPGGRNNDQTTTEEPAAGPGDTGAEAVEPTNPTRPSGGNGGRQTSSTISIRFMTPWTNSSAIMHAGNATDSMKLVKNYCGWFESKVPAPGEGQSAQIYFTQTLGGTPYGAGGLNNTDPISLDSILAAGATTVWIKPVPFPNGTPTLYSDFPTGSLGVCTKKLPVMVFDWYHGENGDGGVRTSTRTNRDSTVTTTTTYGNGAKDQDPTLGPLYATSNDFGSGGCGRRTAGMVEPVLGPNGVPVRAAVFPESCQLTEHINNWFLPQVVAHDAAGKEYTNATCREIELEMDENGMWLGQRDKNSPAGGLFLLDDFQFLDPAETVKNPFYDNLSGQGARGGRHNFGFIMKIQAQFEYVPGQYFSFFGDDDVWVFINNRLVVDIGGQHAQEEGAVDLDTLGLTPGVTYPFHIFYAERHIYESNFKMLTSIDLQTEASLLLSNLSTDTRNLNYEIWQIVREQQLSCDFSNTMQTKDTTRAPSNFNLSGGNLPAEGVYLDSAGTWYGGIIINKDMSGFKVNVDAIKEARALSPGQYCVRFSLQADPTQGDEVWFEVDAYALPTVVFSDNKWKVLGSNLNSQVTPIGEWAYQKYQVNVQYEEEWGAEYDDILYINVTDSLISVVDEAGNPINSITLSKGKGTFYIIGKGEVVNATLMVKGAASANTATWTNINLKLPPVPLVDYAIMYDRDGDGRADSLYVKYTKELVGKSKIDSLQFTFGEKFPVLTKYILYNDSTLVLTAEGGFGNTVFTGSNDTLYNGLIETWFTFSDNGGKSVFPITGDIIDRVNPIITSAEVEITDHNTNLVITFSEAIADSSKGYYLELFAYKCWRTGVLKDPIDPMSIRKVKPNIWKMPFNGGLNDVVPAVGDSIRLVPGDAPLYITGHEVAYDLSGTSPHLLNPWVRITGDQEVQITSAPVASVNAENEKTVAIVTNKEATVPTLITDMTKDVKEIVDEYGVQGHLIGFDMAQLAQNENAAVVADIDKGKLTVDILRQIENNEISLKKAKKTYGLSDATVNAIKEGTLNSGNIAGVKNGTVKVMSKENITLHYKTSYFTSLGHYVNGESGSIACADTIYKGDCLNNGGNLFLAWNMRATDNRLVATGVYIARLEIKVKAGKKVISEMTRDMLWGVRRGKVNALDLNIK
ncbi:MAG: fibro-slime domain-containing protein [Fibrobacter sp.]|nr:fibro-slime domain-containing protein [Fibrobacter sp.]